MLLRFDLLCSLLAVLGWQGMVGKFTAVIVGGLQSNAINLTIKEKTRILHHIFQIKISRGNTSYPREAR